MRLRSTTVHLLLAAAGLAIVSPSAALAALPSLGLAGNYAIFGSHSVEILVNSNGTTVDGDVAIGPAGVLNFMGGGTIMGKLDTDAASIINVSGGSQILGGQFLIDMVPVDDDARAATALANTFFSTQSFNSIGNGTTIFGNGGLNVINVTTNILLTNGGSLTLMGNGSDEFLFNINGTMTLTGASSIIPVGVSPDQILWNFVGDGQEVLFENSSGLGTILAIDRDIRLEGGSVLGALISNGDRIKLQDGAQVIYSPIPEPTTGVLTIVSLSLLSFLRRRTLA